MDHEKATGLVALDLSKAFDTIDHFILLNKLRNIGCNDKAINFFKNYLNNRSQVTKVNNQISDTNQIICGVPQGSVLGPLLFTIYINDLPEVLKFCKINMFADDTSIYKSGKNPEEIEVGLNADLINIQEWLVANKLCLNVEKTNFMVISSSKTAHRFKNTEVILDDTAIAKKNHIKILGVTLNNTLTWDLHAELLANKIRPMARALLRSTKYMDMDTKKILYNATIASRLN